MFRISRYSMLLLLIATVFSYCCIFTAQAQTMHGPPYTIYGYPPVTQGTKVQDKVGSTAVSFLYQYDTTVSSLEEAADRIGVNTDANLIDPDTGIKAVGLGSHVIKVWFEDSDLAAGTYPNVTSPVPYPLVTNWGSPAPANLKELAQSPPMVELFSNSSFDTYVLEAFEFDADCHDSWKYTGGTNKWTTTQQTCVYNEFYNLAQYLLQTYSGTGKTFILQNWESDNDLEAADFSPVPAATETCTNPSEPNYPADFCTSVANMTQWLNIRWQAVNDARNSANTTYSDVTVAAAAEVNYIDNYNSVTVPSVLDLIVPKLHMDLYSCSCYYTVSNAANLPNVPAGSPPRQQNLYNELQEIRTHINQPQSGDTGTPLYQNAANSLYVGELSATENDYYTSDNWGEAYADPLTGQSMPSDQESRVVLGQAIQGGLSANAKWILFWELYSNGSTTYSSSPYNSVRAVWLVRPPCNTTDSTQEWCNDSSHTGQTSKPEQWTYLSNVMTQPISSYQNTYEAEDFYTGISGPAQSGHTLTELDYADPNMTGGYGTYMEYAAVGSELNYSLFVPNAGSQATSIHVKSGVTHGQFQVYLNGSATALPGGPFETYAAANGYPTISIGNVTYTAGVNTLTLKVSGKNTSATGYNLIIDNIQITP